MGTKTVPSAKAAVAANKRHGNTVRAAEAELDLREALLAKRIRELADAMPPLSEERRARLAQLLAPAVS
jgi:hypothetical protein